MILRAPLPLRKRATDWCRPSGGHWPICAAMLVHHSRSVGRQAPSSKGSRFFSGSSYTSASLSSRRRASKVSTLSIKLPADAAKRRGKNLVAAQAISGSSASRFYKILHAASVLCRETMGIDFTRYFERHVTLERFSTVYLPYWCIDAKFTCQLLGEDGRKAIAQGQSFMSLFPAHNWQELRSLPVSIPKAGVMPTFGEPSNADHDENEELYEAFEPSPAEDATVLPFVVSPHSLIAQAKTSDVPSEGVTFAFLRAIVPPSKFQAWLYRRYFPERAAVRGKLQEIFDVDSDYKFKVDASSIALNFMAAQPVLLPFHVAKFQNSGFRTKTIKEDVTMVLPAWDPTCQDHVIGGINVTKNRKRVDSELLPQPDKWYYPSFGGQKELAHITATSLPRPPCAPTVLDAARSYHELMDEAEEQERERGFKGTGPKRTLFPPLKSLELATKQHEDLDRNIDAAAMASFNEQASHWLSTRPLEPMLKEEQAGHAARMEHNASARAVEADQGLGEAIDWDNKFYMRLFDEEHKKVRNHMFVAGMVDEADSSLKSVQLFSGKRLEILAEEHPEVEEGIAAKKRFEESLHSNASRKYKWSYAAARSEWMKPK